MTDYGPDVPDPDVVGARAEALLKWQEQHPDATIEEIMEASWILGVEK